MEALCRLHLLSGLICSAVDSGRGKLFARVGMHNTRHSSSGCGGTCRKFGISTRQKLKLILATVRTRVVQRFARPRKKVKLQLNTRGRSLDSMGRILDRSWDESINICLKKTQLKV